MRILRALRVYLTVFLWTGAVYGCLTGLLLWDDGPAAALRRALVFGLCMSLLLGTFQVVATRRVPPGHSISPHQRLEVPVRPDPWLAHRVHAALVALPAAVLSADPVAGRWVARTPKDWRSPGEEVVVELRGPIDAPVASVSSRPLIRWAVVDTGRGWRNVSALASSLQPAAGHQVVLGD